MVFKFILPLSNAYSFTAIMVVDPRPYVIRWISTDALRIRELYL